MRVAASPLRIAAASTKPLDFAHRQKLYGDGLLGQRVDEPRDDDLDLIHFRLQEQVAGKGGDRAGLGETRRVARR